MKFTQVWNIKFLQKVNKFNLDDESLLMALTIFVSAASGGLAVLLMKTTHWLAHHLGTLHTPTLYSALYSLVFILIAGYITTRIAPAISGSGVPQTKIHYIVNHGIIPAKEWMLKFMATILSLSSGFCLGREGPTLAVASGIGSAVGQFFRLSKNQIKTLLAVGSAAGIAAAFNTPIAAVTFTLEEIVGSMNAKSLGPIIVGAVVATVIAQILTGGDPNFDIGQYSFEDPADLIFYFGLGILAALMGPVWIKTIMKFRQMRLTLFRGHRLTYLMTVSYLLLLVAFYNSDVLGTGHDVINNIFKAEHFELDQIFILLIIKFIFIALCYSTGLSGGLFMPCLLMGGLLGAGIGIIAKVHFGLETQIGAFALVGMGAFFASVIKAPITSILMIFELTQDYRVMLPLMIANITSYIISNRFMKGSVYEQLAEQDGMHLPSREDSDVLEQLTVEEAMVHEPYVLQWESTIRESMMEVNKTNFSGFPVLKNGRLVGIVSKNEIASSIVEHNEDDTVGSIATRQLITIYPDQSLLLALHYLERYKVSRLLVVSRLNDKFLRGIITPSDIVERFGIHIQENNDQDKHLAHIIKSLSSEAENKSQE